MDCMLLHPAFGRRTDTPQTLPKDQAGTPMRGTDRAAHISVPADCTKACMHSGMGNYIGRCWEVGFTVIRHFEVTAFAACSFGTINSAILSSTLSGTMTAVTTRAAWA